MWEERGQEGGEGGGREMGLNDEKVKEFEEAVERLNTITMQSVEMAKVLLNRAFQAWTEHQEALSRNDAQRALPLLLKATDLFKRADAIVADEPQTDAGGD